MPYPFKAMSQHIGEASQDRARTSNTPWFKLDSHIFSDELEDMLMGGSAIDAPDYIASGGTRTQDVNRYAIITRMTPR